MRVGFVGLGKLGIEVAEAMADYHDVVGYDIRPKATPLSGTLQEAAQGEFVFVAVQTPHSPLYEGIAPTSHLPPKDFDYGPLRCALTDIGKYVNPSQRVVVISTCLPGVVPDLAKLVPCPLIYNPYFIAMGTVKRDFLNPEMMVIGTQHGDDPEGQELVNFYEGFVETQHYIRCRWDEAACIKVFFNTFVSARIALVNMILDVSEKMGLDAGVICDAFTKSKKQKEGYWMPGMGDGGPCHPRDNNALRSLSERLGLGYDIFGTVMTAREKQAENLARRLVSFEMPVVILGKSFKPGTLLTDGSYSLLVGHYVEKMGHEVAYDQRSVLPRTYLLGHRGRFHDHPFAPGSVIVDPWGECPDVPLCHVHRYGRASAPVGVA